MPVNPIAAARSGVCFFSGQSCIQPDRTPARNTTHPRLPCLSSRWVRATAPLIGWVSVSDRNMDVTSSFPSLSMLRHAGRSRLPIQLEASKQASRLGTREIGWKLSWRIQDSQIACCALLLRRSIKVKRKPAFGLPWQHAFDVSMTAGDITGGHYAGPRGVLQPLVRRRRSCGIPCFGCSSS